MHVGKCRGHDTVSFIFGYRYSSDIGNEEIGPCHTNFGCGIFFSQNTSYVVGQCFGCAVGRSAEFLVKQCGDVLFGFMHSRCYNVIWFFAGHLNNEFTQICFYRFHSQTCRCFVQLNFFGGHRFAFHQEPCLIFSQYFPDIFRSFLCIFSPKYLCTIGRHVFFEFQQVMVPVFQYLAFDGSSIDFGLFHIPVSRQSAGKGGIVARNVEFDSIAVFVVKSDFGSISSKFSGLQSHRNLLIFRL